MARKQNLQRPRVKTPREARRCLKALADYFRRHESPLAAEDLEDAVAVLLAARPSGRPSVSEESR